MSYQSPGGHIIIVYYQGIRQVATLDLHVHVFLPTRYRPQAYQGQL